MVCIEGTKIVRRSREVQSALDDGKQLMARNSQKPTYNKHETDSVRAGNNTQANVTANPIETKEHHTIPAAALWFYYTRSSLWNNSTTARNTVTKSYPILVFQLAIMFVSGLLLSYITASTWYLLSKPNKTHHQNYVLNPYIPLSSTRYGNRSSLHSMKICHPYESTSQSGQGGNVVII